MIFPGVSNSVSPNVASRLAFRICGGSFRIRISGGLTQDIKTDKHHNQPGSVLSHSFYRANFVFVFTGKEEEEVSDQHVQQQEDEGCGC